jgi:hypothetical protein
MCEELLVKIVVFFHNYCVLPRTAVPHYAIVLLLQRTHERMAKEHQSLRVGEGPLTEIRANFGVFLGRICWHYSC